MPTTRKRIATAIAVAGAMGAVLIAVLVGLPRTEAQEVDYWSLTPPEQQLIRERDPPSFEPRLTQPPGTVLHIISEVQDQSLPAPVVYDSYAYVEDRKAPRVLVTTSDPSGRALGVQLTVNGRTRLEDGTVIETGVATLADLLPSIAPNFVLADLHLEEVSPAEADARTFEVHAPKPNEQYVRQITISTNSNVVLTFSLFEDVDGERRLLDRRATRFEWLPLTDAPAELLEGVVN